MNAQPQVGLVRYASCLALTLLAGLPLSAGSPFAETIRVEMTEFAFHPAVIRLKVGVPVRLQFMEFACTIEGHREAGMRGRLEVR